MGTCDAVQDVLGTAPATILPTPYTFFVLSLPRSPRTAWARPSEAAPTLIRTGPWPAGLSERHHNMPGGRYPLQQRPRRLLELQGRRRDLRKAKDDAQDDCHARRHTPQYTFYSARPLHPRDSGRGRRLSRSPVHVHAPPCVYKRRRQVYLRGFIHPVEHNTQHYSQSTYALLSPDIGTHLNQLLL